ncbi:MAG: hypothetical protein M3156_07190 [Thermoproteota archaeon]|nr:hypothetical protein [Thermoproteota archaeon]
MNITIFITFYPYLHSSHKFSTTLCDTYGYAIDYARESDKKLNNIKVTQDVDRETCHVMVSEVCI